MSIAKDSELSALAALSARIGRDPLLAQASSGNTSIKLRDAMWIKASGKWLIDADHDDIFVCIPLEEARRQFASGLNLTGAYHSQSGLRLAASIETAMHALIPRRVVVHLHSINAIAWAVRQDGCAQLTKRLAGLRWLWIPYVPSGLPLAHEIMAALASDPEARVLMLANHGLVLCGDSCEAIEDLLWDVERRLAIPPRRVPQPDHLVLQSMLCGTRWRLPEVEAIHALATDDTSRSIVSSGVLYPCQAIFLGGVAKPFAPHNSDSFDSPFLLLERVGAVLNENITPAESETLAGLTQVALRLGSTASVRYLSQPEINRVLHRDAPAYRAAALKSRTPAPGAMPSVPA
jgi:rhamnose utilization protein RhaD (predicted bifunctional aldolase and dehydrogenase)